MASSSASLKKNNSNSDDKAVSSSFLRTVCLHDWWLIKAEKDFNGRRLAIGGLESRGRSHNVAKPLCVQRTSEILGIPMVATAKVEERKVDLASSFFSRQSVRVFSSAPIMKRYDVFTLETADGINVMLKGFMNRSHTLRNGFPSEVCSHFLFGFPQHWEAYAERCFSEESSTLGVSTSISDFDELSMASGSNSHRVVPIELEGSSVTRARILTKNITTNTVGNCHGNALKCPTVVECPDMEYSPLIISSLEETLNQYEKSKSEPRHEDDKHILNAANVGLEDIQNIPSEKNYLSGVNLNKLENEVSKRESLKKISNNFTDVTSKDSTLQDCETDMINQAEQNLSSDTAKDGTSKDHKLFIGLNMGIVTPSKLNKAVPMETLSICSTILSSMESSKGNQKQDVKKKRKPKSKHTKFVTSAVSQDFENVLLSSIEDRLSGDDRSNLASLCHDGIAKEPFSKEPDAWHPKSSKILEDCSYNVMEYTKAQSDSKMDVISPSKTDISENPGGEKLAGRSPLSTNIPSKCGGARTRSSLKNQTSSQKRSLASNLLVRNKNDNPSSVSDLSESSSGGKLAGRSPLNTLDLLDTGYQDTTPKLLVENLDGFPKCGSQEKFLFSSVATEIHDQNCRNFTSHDVAESRDLNESSKSPTRHGDVRDTNTLKIPVREEESNEQVCMSGKKAKRKLGYVTLVSPLTKDRTKECSVESPGTLSFKRSRSGRLLLPTLHFWRNQIPIYDRDGAITGIQEGLPSVISPTGSRSEPRRKKKRPI